MNEICERDFKGIWIPKEIWLNERLSSTDKMLFAEINSLDGEDGCFASNEYLAEFMHLKTRSIQDSLKRLKEEGLVYQESFDGRARVLRTVMPVRRAKKCTSDVQELQDVQKNASQTCKKMHVSHNVYNNIYNNNIDDNIEKEIYKEKEKEPIIEPEVVEAEEVKKEKSCAQKERSSSMKRPTLDEVRAKIMEKGYSVDAEAFWNYYESNGWKVGKNPMKKWESALVTWQKKEDEHKNRNYGTGKKFNQREYLRNEYRKTFGVEPDF